MHTFWRRVRRVFRIVRCLFIFGAGCRLTFFYLRLLNFWGSLQQIPTYEAGPGRDSIFCILLLVEVD